MSYWQRSSDLSSFGALSSLLPGTPEEGSAVSPSPVSSDCAPQVSGYGQQQPSFGEVTTSQFGPSLHLLRCKRMSVVGGRAEVTSLPLVAEHLARVLDPHFVGDAGPGQTNKFGEWRVRSAGAARQCWNEAGDRSVAMPIQSAKINRVDRVARWAAYPEEPIRRGNGGADCGREQPRHPPALALVPSDD